MDESVDQAGQEDGHEEDEHPYLLAVAFLDLGQISEEKIILKKSECIRVVRDLLRHFGCKVIGLVSVIPTDVLP